MAEGKGKVVLVFVTGLVFLGGYVVLLYLLQLSGYIVFVNRTSLFQEYITYLGGSVYFFAANFILFCIGCLMLFASIKKNPPAYHDVRFWDFVVNISITLFFGIGVIYTAVGMQRAFQIALGNINQEMAVSMGPWGILQKLVNGGLLMALFTTIVGGAIGYCLRLLKFLIFGKNLIRLKDNHDSRYYKEIINGLETISNQLTSQEARPGRINDE